MEIRMTTHQRMQLATKRLREVNARFNATLADAKKELAEAKAELEREKTQDRVDDRFAERARSGKAGRDMRRIQELVDRGQLKWDDVLLGKGEEWMTNAVRRTMGHLKAAIEREGLAEAKPGTGSKDDSYFDNPLKRNPHSPRR